MDCPSCGKKLPTVPVCPSWGRPTRTSVGSVPPSGAAPSRAASGRHDPPDQPIDDTRRTAEKLAHVSARMSMEVLEKASDAANSSPDSVKRAEGKVAQQLDKARREIEAALEELK